MPEAANKITSILLKFDAIKKFTYKLLFLNEFDVCKNL